jgi:uncharacterized membrane protein YcjF (UPF0283 family)
VVSGAGNGAYATTALGDSAEAAAERAPNALADGASGKQPTQKEHTLATTGATGRTRVDAPRTSGVRARVAERNHETKAAFKTTEFWAMIALVVAILISAAVINGGDNGTDEFIARNAWLYVSILGAGYFVSRGLAKSGSYEPDPDYNPVDIGLDERVGDRTPNGR